MSDSALPYTWRLREHLASQGIWKTTELAPLLAARGVVLSPAQVYRLVAKVPERLSLRTLAALCDICECTPNDLIDLITPSGPMPGAPGPSTGSRVVEIAGARSLKRARVSRRDP